VSLEDHLVDEKEQAIFKYIWVAIFQEERSAHGGIKFLENQAKASIFIFILGVCDAKICINGKFLIILLLRLTKAERSM